LNDQVRRCAREAVSAAVVVVLGTVFAAVDARAAEIVDQANTPTPQQSYNIGSFTPSGQEFIPTQTALTFADFFVEDGGSDIGPGCNIRVDVHAGTMSGPVVGSSQVLLAPDGVNGYMRFPFATPAPVTPGDTYVLEAVKLSSGTGTLNYFIVANLNDTYSRGRPVRSGTPVTTAQDYLFRTGRSTAAGPRTSGTLQPFAYSGIEDTGANGTADTLLNGAFISRTPGGANPAERRAAFEYDVTGYGVTGIASATLTGTLFMNNANDTGTRTVNVDVYSGDGLITTLDFSLASLTAGSFSYHPPAQTSIPFSIDVTDELRALLSGGASFLGARFTPANDQSVSVLTDSQPPALNIVVPEPAAAGTLLLLLGPAALSRRRRPRRRRC
jgi:hypothetical protein